MARDIYSLYLNIINHLDLPFEVAFVETTYTVDESVGSVNVCVNLTQPEFDILDRTVNVFVIDNSSAVYVPVDAPLASESQTL